MIKIKRIKFKSIILVMLCLTSILFSGCQSIDNLKVKLKIKNPDFDYIKENKVEKIVIQNTRDKGFRFLITDKKAIRDLYDILSSAKPVQEKSLLKPDYVFEINEGSNKVHKFNYIAGLDKKDAGNLYNNNKIYIVSKRIDNDIIQSFWTIRKPKDFEEVYYESLIEVLKRYGIKKENKNLVGINIYNDVDISKFVLSTDLENFKSNLKSQFSNVTLKEKDINNYDIVMNVKTQGYKSTMYKAIIKVENKKDRTEKKYYVMNEYKNGRWEFNIKNKMPDKF